MGRLIDLNTSVLLLEDSTSEKFPDYVNLLLSKIDIKNLSQGELLSILIYCIALETGFASITAIKALNNNDNDNDQDNMMKMKSKYCLNTYWGYSFHLQNIMILCSLPTFNINENNYRSSDENVIKNKIALYDYSNIECLLICIQCGEYLICTLTPNNNNSLGKSLCLSISRYVQPIKKLNLTKRFKNLKELSFLLKDQLFIPIRNYLMSEDSQSYYPGLNGLPSQILSIILNNLSLHDIQQLSKTCLKLRNECLDYYQIKYMKKRST